MDANNTSLDIALGNPLPLHPEPKSEHDLKAAWSGSEPVASIICHTYNHAPYIRNTLNGFLAQQTTFPFEILIHDDASNDGTAEILKEYASRYPAIIRLILQETNQYALGYRPGRVTIPSAKANYLAFCEGDDFWIDPNKLSKQVEFLRNNPEYVITYTNSIPFDESGILNTDFGGAKRDLSADELKRSPPIYTLTTCFRSVLDIPPERYLASYGDLFMWSQLGFHGKGKYMPDIKPSMYRVHSGGVQSMASFRKKQDMLVETYSALFAYYRRLGNIELQDYFRRRVLLASLRASGYTNKTYSLLRVFSKIPNLSMFFSHEKSK